MSHFMPKKVFTLYLIILIGLFSVPQKLLSANDEIDTTKARLLIKQSEKYWYVFPDSAVYLAQEAIKLIDTLDHKKLLSLAFSSFGTSYFIKGDYSLSLDYYFRALDLDKELNDLSSEASTLSNIGNIYMVKRKFVEADEFFTSALEIKHSLKDRKGIGHTTLNIANLYSMQGDFDNALAHALKALAMFSSLNDRESLVTVYSTIASINNSLGRPEEALIYYDFALEISRERKDIQNECVISLNMGNVFSSKGKTKVAINYFENALALAQELNYLQGLSSSFERLHFAYETLNMPEEALLYYKLFISTKDSLMRKGNAEALLKKSLEYKFEKEREMTALEQKEKRKRQNLIIIGVLVLLFGSLIVVFLIFRSYREKEKANFLLQNQNKLINEQNKEIIDSITYAERIQTAKLPKREEIFSAFPQSFILFLPKDIVSGDFYFFKKKDDLLFIAAVDCTGHGVPGAFMSLISIEELSIAVQKTNDPGEVLSMVNKGIRSSLNQSEESGTTRDGMDIALCSIDLKKGVVNYAGAFNPLWIIRNGSAEIEIVNATRKSLGGFTQENQEFETNNIQIQKGDSIYLFSDGYMDQDGGPKGKRLMSKNFKKELIEIREKTMPEQEKYLKKFMENWRGDKEQIDDILVMGIRL